MGYMYSIIKSPIQAFHGVPICLDAMSIITFLMECIPEVNRIRGVNLMIYLAVSSYSHVILRCMHGPRLPAITTFWHLINIILDTS